MERQGALELFRRPDFRRVYLAVIASELGDAFQYIALMWFALVSGGPLGVLAVRLADSVPALAFGFHGGLVADRLDRRRTMVAADVFRGALLVPIAEDFPDSDLVGIEITGEFLVSTGYLPGAHDRACPVFARIARRRPPWMRA